jgi:predicted nuclease with TOPRIM domain
MATTIETDLKEVLGDIQKELREIRGDLNELKVSQAQIKGELAAFQAEIKGDLNTLKVEVSLIKEDVKYLKGSQRSQIWVLIVAVVGAIIKFGFFPNP